MSDKTDEEKKKIQEEVEKLSPNVRSHFTNSSRLEVLERLLIKKGILSVEEMEEEGFKVMEKRLKDIK